MLCYNFDSLVYDILVSFLSDVFVIVDIVMFYIEVVGLDGAGKSRLCRSLVWKLKDRARCIHVSLAEITREAASLVATSDVVSPLTRAMTYMASHCEAYDRIAADLDSIEYLIGDRGYACFYAYQYLAGSDVIDSLWSLAMRGIYPNLLVFLDTPVWLCQERIARRSNPSVMDKKPASFHNSVRDRYLAFLDSYNRGETLTLDGTRHPNILCKQVLKRIKSISTDGGT